MQDQAFTSLETPRLVIDRFEAADAAAFAAYRSDPEVARHQGWDAPYPLRSAEAFIASLDGLAPGTPGTWFQFAVRLATTRALIGDVAIHTRESDGEQAELGFTLASAHQGQGIGSEAVRAVVQYAFTRLGMHRIFALTDARNEPAQRLLERLDFRREGELLESVRCEDGWATELLYARLSSEWLDGPCS